MFKLVVIFRDVPKQRKVDGEVSKTFLNSAVIKLISTDKKDRVFRPQPAKIRVEDSAYITHTAHRLPHWVAKIAWVIALVSSIVASFFVSLYGLKYGRTKSLEWTVSFFSGVSQDVLVNQPLKVLVVSCFIAMLLMKPVEREPEGAVEWYPDLAGGLGMLLTRVRYRPPSPEWIAAVRRIAILTKRMNQWLVDIGWFLVFMVALFMFTYGNTPTRGFGVRRALQTSFGLPSEEKDTGFSGVSFIVDLMIYWGNLAGVFTTAKVYK